MAKYGSLEEFIETAKYDNSPKGSPTLKVVKALFF
jgi:hypothetical protein